MQVGRIVCPPHKQHRGGPLTVWRIVDHLSLLLVTSHFSMAPPHSWRCPNCDLKSYSSASRSGTLGDGQFQHHDRIVFQTCQGDTRSHMSLMTKGGLEMWPLRHTTVLWPMETKSSVPGDIHSLPGTRVVKIGRGDKMSPSCPAVTVEAKVLGLLREWWGRALTA